MKGHCINLDGQLVCIFPFTNATSFERMAHNDLPSLCIVGDESGLPLEVVEDNDCQGRHFGWCFLSCPVSWTRRPIMERDRGDIAALALENDAWVAEQVRETDAIASQASTHVKIHVQGGCVTEVEASPDSVTYQIVDLDLLDEDREESAERVHVSGVIDDGSIPLGDEQDQEA